MGYGVWARVAILLLQFLAFRAEPRLDEIDPKSVIRTIKSNDGQIFDCVSFMSQPSLQHPLLRNHTVQMQSASSYALGIARGNVTKFSNPSVEMSEIECPPRTVPILRSYNGSTAYRPLNMISGGNPDENDRRGYIAAVATSPSTFYASYSEISVWEPDLGMGKPPRFSGAITTMQNGREPKISAVYAGWFVDPHLYGDDRVHFEIGWKDNGKACINLRCPGFVQVSRKVTPGSLSKPISMINGVQYVMQVTIFQDQHDANWCLNLGKEFVGYWPKELFRYMSEAASMVGWVGAADAAAGETYPPMGSGEPPENGRGRSAFFDRAQIVDQSKQVVVPDLGNIFIQTTDPNCYRVGRTDTSQEGLRFYFGGPGCKPS
ncbi:hypothetical protein ACP70R_001662 [Stipagrostis hirtigluma subsp. patula]